MMDEDAERLIARFRAELAAEAEIARDDLDEIEDHVRLLADDLRTHGVPGAEAVAQACRRLGDPRELAREHVRARSPFGAQLTRLRAWGAAVAMLLPVVFAARVLSWHRIALDIPWLVIIGALVARRTWARPLVLGFLAARFVGLALVMAIDGLPEHSTQLLGAVFPLTAVVLVMPWQRHEIGTRGVVLALLVPALEATWLFLRFAASRWLATDLLAPFAPPWSMLTVAMACVAGIAAIFAIVGVLRGKPWVRRPIAAAGVLYLACVVATFASSHQDLVKTFDQVSILNVLERTFGVGGLSFALAGLCALAALRVLSRSRRSIHAVA